MSRRTILFAAVIVTLLCSGMSFAGPVYAAGVDDFRSGCKDTTFAPMGTALTLYVVPSGMRFVLTDFDCVFQDSQSRKPRGPIAIVSGTSVRWRTYQSMGTTNGVNVSLKDKWATGVSFNSGEAVQATIGEGAGADPIVFCWSGYLVPSSTSSVVPEGQGGSIQLGIVPNPTSGSNRVRFSTSERLTVTVAIFDVQGRRVRTILTGALEPGDHAVAWDGKDDAGHPVGAGTYFARLEAGGHRAGSGKVTRFR